MLNFQNINNLISLHMHFKTVGTTNCLSNLYHDNLLTTCAHCTFIFTVVHLLIFFTRKLVARLLPSHLVRRSRGDEEHDNKTARRFTCLIPRATFSRRRPWGIHTYNICRGRSVCGDLRAGVDLPGT